MGTICAAWFKITAKPDQLDRKHMYARMPQIAIYISRDTRTGLSVVPKLYSIYTARWEVDLIYRFPQHTTTARRSRLAGNLRTRPRTDHGSVDDRHVHPNAKTNFASPVPSHGGATDDQ